MIYSLFCCFQFRFVVIAAIGFWRVLLLFFSLPLFSGFYLEAATCFADFTMLSMVLIIDAFLSSKWFAAQRMLLESPLNQH